jgi:hypothetical protein
MKNTNPRPGTNAIGMPDPESLRLSASTRTANQEKMLMMLLADMLDHHFCAKLHNDGSARQAAYTLGDNCEPNISSSRRGES